ncbi:diguanylate cyclase [Kineococcus aurantiacus]|uniref:Diguanylate cyclase (GGDEF)-like protein n=1 Tax=Kineococcus aurantiacus TaxID=37633 RepID=A0A7Y9DME5_9ACTN|nr:diguanylate cyclase (GGDEF)-like protein [Kineococcus aurantiacus]
MSVAGRVVLDPARELLRRDLAALDELIGADPQRAAESALALAERAVALGDADAAVLARVGQAEAVQRGGDSAGAAHLLTQLRAQHDELGPEAAVRVAWTLARVFTDLGDRPTALEHALDAAGGCGDDLPRRLRTRVFVKVADLLDELGAHEDSRAWYGRAEQLAVGDGQLHLLVVNNRAYCELERGDVEAARREMALLLELSDRYDRPLNANSLDTVARIHLLCGELVPAEAAARAAVETSAAMDAKNADDGPVCLLTLAVVLRVRGEAEAAARVLDEARAACAQEGFGTVRSQILAEQAEVFAALGDYRAAFETHKAFHAADRELLSEQREAQARARQAVFEIDVARQEAARYREEARRDPLTGLRNRLFVDERLPELLAESRRGGRVAGAVLLDLDHFKAVNDTYSHEAGDEVLRRLARILTDAVDGRPGPESFAARLGGEEFLLVVTGGHDGCAAELAERVRRTVEQADWSAVTPGRGITVSAGVATLATDGDKSSLLAVADERLYAAKAAGRNRVCAG